MRLGLLFQEVDHLNEKEPPIDRIDGAESGLITPGRLQRAREIFRCSLDYRGFYQDESVTQELDTPFVSPLALPLSEYSKFDSSFSSHSLI